MLKFLRRKLSITAAVATLVAGPALAVCDGSITTAEFERLTSSTGGTADVTWPEGVFPLGHPMTVNLDHVPENNTQLRYRAWARAVGSSEPPVPLDVTSVSSDIPSTSTAIQLEVDLGPEQTPWLTDRSVFLLAACEDDEAASMPLAFASLERSVSTLLLGILVAAAALVASAVIAVAAGSALGQSRQKGDVEEKWRFRGLFVDHRDKMSLSLFQVGIFSIIILVSVAYVFGRTRELSDLSEDVLFLLGISAAGAIGGRVGDVQKNRLNWEDWAWLKFTVKAFPEDETAQKPQWLQLVSRNGRFDLYRFQALAFTLLVAPAFAIMSIYSLGDAEIPDGILAVLGLSQATYLFGKIAEPPTIQDFNKSVKAIRKDLADPNVAVSDERWEQFQHEFTEALEVPWNPKATKP